MELLKRRVLFGGLIGLLIITIIFIFFLYVPKIVRRNAIDKEVAALRKQVKENEAMARDLVKMRTQVTDLEESERSFMSRVAPRSDILTTIRQLVILGQPYNLLFTGIQPPGLDTLMQSDKTDRPLAPIPFVITVQGRYLDVAQYIESLKEFPYFLRTPEIEITSKDEIRPNVEVRILINIYASSLVSPNKS
jgi:Tfp pilus assembly protein PilO